LGLAYVHLVHLGNDALLADIRKGWGQALIVNRPGRALQDVGSDIAAGRADLESYGRFVLSTPDFTARLKSGSQMNEPDQPTWYGGGAKGYTDYPTLARKALA
jgi:N-ethylmaleimide reductase